MEKQNVIDFLKDLSWSWYCELNNLKEIVTFDKAFWWKQIYFCAGLDKKPTGRCKDNDFTKKKYVFVDIDIRNIVYDLEKRVIDDDELAKIGWDILWKLSKDYWNYKYSVFSWNGIHLYYVGDEIQIDYKTYAEWVEKFYKMIDSVIYPFVCDQACKNIARITRMPWSINTRTKKKWDIVLWDMGDIECEIIESIDKKFDMNILFEYSEQIKKEIATQKEEERIIRQIVWNVKWDDQIFDEINKIPAYELAEYVRWVRYRDCGKDNCPLLEESKNMWAYYWKPSNVIVNTWSSLIKNKQEKYFTTYRLVRDELYNWDVKQTLDFFADKYNIKVVQKWVIPPKKQYETKWYVYWNKVFDPFDCMMSGELATVVAKTNSWKTTFAMNLLQSNKKLWKEWFYINLEFAIDTVAKSRRLYINKKRKRNLTDLDPLTPQEQHELNTYVKNYISKFKYHNNPQGETIEDIIDLIVAKNKEWFELFVLDSFSKIKWNSEKDSRWKQNQAMQKLQELCQSLWIVIVVLHHTNKNWDFEWSQKIMDDSNVFIVVWRDTSPSWTDTTTFTLSKDKFISYIEIQCMFENWEYIPMF